MTARLGRSQATARKRLAQLPRQPLPCFVGDTTYCFTDGNPVVVALKPLSRCGDLGAGFGRRLLDACVVRSLPVFPSKKTKPQALQCLCVVVSHTRQRRGQNLSWVTRNAESLT